MYFAKSVILFLGLCLVVLGDGFSVGDPCEQGVCKILSDCPSAQQDKNKGIEPPMCGPDVVCCISDQSETLVLTTAKRPDTTTEYVPTEANYENLEGTKLEDGCAPIDPSLTSKPTGQKSWDKCLEYQDKYVFPCEDEPALTGGKSRVKRCHHNADMLIIAGTAAEVHEFPHMVLLGHMNELKNITYQCGGTLISEKFVLTAAHCISDRSGNDVSHALIGILKRSDESSSNRYGIKRIIKHDKYHSPIKYHDIALLELDREVPLSHRVVPACLHTGDDSVDDTRASATGWGSTANNIDNSFSDILQKVILHKLTTEECSPHYEGNRHMKDGVDPKSQVCYGDNEKKSRDTCQGDSGGPLQVWNKKIKCMYTIVGVTSFGRECGSNEVPAIYTRVVNYLPWIEGIVWPN